MRRDTRANWEANNPTLAEGEMGIELDTHAWKFGYQNLPWNSLPYSNSIFSGPSEIVGNNSNVSLTITQVGSGDVFKVQDSTDPDLSPFIIKGNGDVGIGVASPTAKLDVSGTAKFSGQITSTVATGSSPLVVTSTTKVENLNSDLLDGQSRDYYTTAGNLTGTIPSTVLGNSNLYVGTTSIALNRASSSQSLTGISIDGNAGTVTNGVYTSGSYSNPSWLTGLAWSKISSTPTTVSGYGITDAINTSSTSQTKNGNLTIVGTLTATDVVLTGTGTTISTTNLSVTDSLIYLADSQFDSDSIDIGIYGAYGDSNPGHYHSGLIRDASDSGKWKLVSGASEPVSNVIDFTGVTYDTLKIGALEVTSTSVVTNLNSDKLDGQDGSYYNDAANLTGTIPSTVLGNSSYYIGTTSIALNRASASQTLTGISIDGNAATVTNGVYTNGTYSNPSWITGLAWSKISSTPTTLAGYGITDAASSAGTFYIGTTSIGVNRPSGAQTLTGVSIDGNAATVTNGVYTSSTLYVGTTSVALNRSSANISLTGISSVAFPGSSSGTATLQAAAAAGTTTITLPSSTGTLALTSDLSSYAALSGPTLTGTLIAVAPTTSFSSIRLPHGSAPSSPANGDVWTTTSGIYIQINGSTIGPLGTGSGGGGTVSGGDTIGSFFLMGA